MFDNLEKQMKEAQASGDAEKLQWDLGTLIIPRRQALSDARPGAETAMSELDKLIPEMIALVHKVERLPWNKHFGMPANLQHDVNEMKTIIYGPHQGQPLDRTIQELRGRFKVGFTDAQLAAQFCDEFFATIRRSKEVTATPGALKELKKRIEW
jgi:hypothetical protein